MAVTSGFFNSLGGDRKYNAEQMSELFNGIINDGVFANIGTAFQVSATTGKNITIGIGRAWFDGIWVNNDALLPMVANDSEVLLDRIDAVVIEINRDEAVREGRIVFVRGVASGNPSRPAMTHDDKVNQYPLAYIRRRSGDSNVIQADITNMIGTSECPYITGILETQNIDKIVAQWESQFNLWFDGLQDSLEGDVAANLASRIIDMELRFDTLAKDRAVYVPLQDASSRAIQGSDATDIQGRTVLGGSSSGGSSDIPPIPDAVEDVSKVGDIVTTARTGLGATWMLCNGAALDRDEYPELSAMMPVTPRGPWNDAEPTKDGREEIFCVKYYNGYYFAITQYYTTDRFSGVHYSKDPQGPWAWIPFNQAKEYLRDIIYANGYYVIVGYSEAEKRSICYYRKGTIASTGWTKAYINNDQYRDVLRVDYIDGMFIAYGDKEKSATGNYIYKATSPDSWTSVQIDKTYVFSIIEAVMKIGTTWYVVTRLGDSRYVDVYKGDSLTSSSLTTIASSSENDDVGSVGFPFYSNDCLYVPMTISSTVVSSHISMLVVPLNGVDQYYNNHIDRVIPSPHIVGSIYANGYYVLTVKSKPLTLLCSKDLRGPWETIIPEDQYGDYYVERIEDYGFSDYSGVICADDSGFLIGLNQPNSPSQVIFSQKSSFLLPEIALSDSAYSYIKVKGD